MERTFSIIKPDATKRNITGSINKLIEDLEDMGLSPNIGSITKSLSRSRISKKKPSMKSKKK